MFQQGKPSNEDHIEFSNGFKRRKVMNETIIEAFSEKVSIDNGLFNEKKILPRSCKEKNVSLYLYKTLALVCDMEKRSCIFTGSNR